MKIPNLIESKKDVFGAYSVMALKNAQMVLDYIRRVADIGEEYEAINYFYFRYENKKPKEEDLWEHPVMNYLEAASKKSVDAPEKTQFIFEKLFKCFPFLKIMGENQRDYSNNKPNTRKRQNVDCNDLWYVLNNMLRVLKTYRDCTTHYIIDDRKWDDGSDFLAKSEQPLAGMVNSYYTVALRNISEKYSYDTKALAFIQDYRMKKEWRADGGRPKMVVNTDFFLSMQNKNGDKTGRLHLSGVGVTLLICLFLEKKYINVFLSKLNIGSGRKPALTDEERKVIHRSMAINSIRLPRERIYHSGKDCTSVAMDMLNEVKRCPAELFGTLDYAGRSRFRTVSQDHNEVFMHRSTDRFAQLSLEYIDYNRLFDSIRFHVNMGKLRYLLNPEKHCIDGQTRVRVIEHQLNGYGRLRDMEHERTKNGDGTFADTGVKICGLDEVRRDDATAENYPYVVDTHARYILENNKVEMSFCKKGILMPNIVEKESGKWNVEKYIPFCRMSTLELPAMMFHIHLLGAEATERRIRDVYDRYLRMFAALADGTLTKDNIGSFGIAEADIPQKVLDAVNGVAGKKDVKAYINKVLDEMLDDTERRIERLKADKKAVGSRDNKMGKRGFRQIVPGRLADFLARDIANMQPSLKKGDGYGMDRITGLNYRVMQASIATYCSDGDSAAFDKFRAMFVSAGLIGGDRSRNHPFLYNALRRQPADTIEFYENYLYARKKYLERLKEDGKTDVPFINVHRNKWVRRDEDFYKIQGEIYSKDIPVELPRQMFDEPIKAYLKTIPKMADVDFDKANVTYLIGEYMKRVCQDGPQEFYSWKRHYRYMDMLVGKTDRKGSLCEQYTTVEEREKLWQERASRAEDYKSMKRRAKRNDRNKRSISDEEYEEGLAMGLANTRNDYQKTEKMIRRYKVQDALLFLMAKKILSDSDMVDFEGQRFKLKDITPDSDKGVLSEIMPMNFKFDKNGRTYTIHSSGMKIKNYGDFYALAHDKRMSSLLELVESATIEKEDIEEELGNYDDSRPKVVKLVFDFEKLAYEKYPEMKNYPLEREKFDFGALLQELVKRNEFERNDTWVLSQIRNAFEHNGYPKKGVVRITTLPEIAKHLIDVFGGRARME